MLDNKISNRTEDRHKHFERPTTQRPPSMFNLTLWAIFVSLAAGFGGYLLANYILPSSSTNYFSVDNLGRNINVDIDQPMVDIGNQHQKSIAGVYKKVATATSIGQTIFSQEDFLGGAVVVTSDGWLMTTDQVASSENVSVVLGDKIYPVDDLAKDEFSGLVFLKIHENFLQPINFQLTEDLKIGEKLFTSADVPNSYDHSFASSYLSNIHYAPDKYLFTDLIDYYIKISDPAGTYASPYFNLKGDLVGLVYYNGDDQTLLIPAEYIKQSIKNLLNNTERPKFGVRYVDLDNNSGFESKGSLVYHPQLVAVAYNSPANKAGIKTNDQIVAVNNDAISGYRTLTSIMQNYRLGDKVIVKVLRDGEEQDIEVSL